MKLYYDGAIIEDFKTLYELGVISGITTNLSFCKIAMDKNNISYLDLLSSIHNEVSKNQNLSLSFQVFNTDINKMIDEALQYNDLFSSNVDLKIKIPFSFKNCEVINKLIKSGVKVNATCVTSFLQGVVAANMGCSYISFFWGKMTDEDIEPEKIITDFKSLLDKNSLNKTSKILVGSIRQPQVIAQAYKCGADIVTTQIQNFPKFLTQLKSEEANNLFQKDWNK